MSESKNVWETDEIFWDFVKRNKHMVGFVISDEQGLDILNALRDIYLTIDEDSNSAKHMITLLAIVLHASSLGEGKQFTDEMQVLAAMEQFDSSMKEILDEEPR